jgi:hypothetical protein
VLSPGKLEKAGRAVGMVYRQIELEMLDYVEDALINGEIYSEDYKRTIKLLSKTSAQDLQKIIEKHQDEIDEAIQEDVEYALRASSKDDVSRIEKITGDTAVGVTARQIASAIESASRAVSRHNLAMNEAARESLINAATEAMIKTSSGKVTREQAKRDAVHKLAHQGIQVVSYKSGASINAADAVERYVRTEISQAGLDLTESLILQNGIEFVEVSSHAGARPSHAEWQGQVYSINGRVEVDGVVYEDFYESTGYGGLKGPYADIEDRLGGVNCGHSFGPWAPGMKRTYELEKEHKSALIDAEIYRLRQGQRRRERDIRVTKRELAGAQKCYEASGDIADKADVAGLKAKLSNQQNDLNEYIKKANSKGNAPVLQRSAYKVYAGDFKMTQSVPKASNRSLRAVMASPSVERKRIKAGMTKKEANNAIHDELDRQGLTLKQFSNLPAKDQAEIINNIF